jgi:hypothetical protein
MPPAWAPTGSACKAFGRPCRRPTQISSLLAAAGHIHRRGGFLLGLFIQEILISVPSCITFCRIPAISVGATPAAAGWPQGHFSVPLLLLYCQFCTDAALSQRDRCRIDCRPDSRALPSALAPSIAAALRRYRPIAARSVQNRLPAGLKGTSKCPCSFYIASFARMQVFRSAIGAESTAGRPQGHFSVPLLLLFQRLCTDTALSRRDRCRIDCRPASRALPSAFAPSLLPVLHGCSSFAARSVQNRPPAGLKGTFQCP